MAIFGKPSEYQKLPLSGAHGIASVTGLRLEASVICGNKHVIKLNLVRLGATTRRLGFGWISATGTKN